MHISSTKVLSVRIAMLALIPLSLAACAKEREEHHAEAHKITATCPMAQPVVLTQEYVCQIHSQRHIKIRALEMGYLEAIKVKEGQAVKEHQILFSVIPILYTTKLEAEKAEARLAKLEWEYSQQLSKDNVVSVSEVALRQAKMAKAQAKADQAEAELNFTRVEAPFDGIIDRLHHQQGSLVQEGEILTTLSDNSVMWVYFNVPEARYLQYMEDVKNNKADFKIELRLANGTMFDQVGTIGAIEADFNNENGNIAFRADFPNPADASGEARTRLLRHGQTGTIVISRVQNDSIVIPQRATFEVLAKRYVYVIDKDHVAHQREIQIDRELEDQYVIKSGVGVEDRIVLEGVRQVRDGDTVEEFEERKPEEVAENMKYHAE
jgi:membrane fusion protein (multidrug efflux system)